MPSEQVAHSHHAHQHLSQSLLFPREPCFEGVSSSRSKRSAQPRLGSCRESFVSFGRGRGAVVLLNSPAIDGPRARVLVTFLSLLSREEAGERSDLKDTVRQRGSVLARRAQPIKRPSCGVLQQRDRETQLSHRRSKVGTADSLVPGRDVFQQDGAATAACG